MACADSLALTYASVGIAALMTSTGMTSQTIRRRWSEQVRSSGMFQHMANGPTPARMFPHEGLTSTQAGSHWRAPTPLQGRQRPAAPRRNSAGSTNMESLRGPHRSTFIHAPGPVRAPPGIRPSGRRRSGALPVARGGWSRARSRSRCSASRRAFGSAGTSRASWGRNRWS